MIKAIVFDCFGVLASDGWLPYKARHFGHDPVLLEQATSLNKQVDNGFISYDDFIRGVATLANLPEATAREQIENNVPDDELFAYIAELKQTYLIGMLSNAGDNWLDEIFKPEQVALFDAIALSYDMHFIKPDSQAYETIAARLGVDPSECVFIDDQPRYVEGAERVGMRAVLYANCEQLKQDLPALIAQSAA
jgi:HAD superfamily hydrolase (TIGR01509 family)